MKFNINQVPGKHLTAKNKIDAVSSPALDSSGWIPGPTPGLSFFGGVAYHQASWVLMHAEF